MNKFLLMRSTNGGRYYPLFEWYFFPYIYKKKIHNHMIFLKGVIYDLWLIKKNMNSAFFLRGGD